MRTLIISSLVLLSSLASCQQKQLSGTTIESQIKMDQKMLDIYKQVKRYDHTPLYEVEFSQDACGYEILINDMPLHRYLLLGSANEQRIPINDHILTSGKQEMIIRLFPPQLSDKSWSPTLVDASKFKIKVIYHNPENATETYNQVFEFSTSNKPGTEKFLGSGQKVFEFKGSFDAEVPYQLEGWRNSKDLGKEDQDKLLKEAIAAYNNFRNVLIKKDVSAYASLMYDKEVELAKAFYWDTPAHSRERWDEMSGTVRQKREILPLKDFKMVLYAAGKVLALQPTSEMYKDYLSAIHAQTENDDIQISFLLHKKAGSNELTPIR
ncbi:hypothetical protein SAMN04487898_106303 [Pedobacter sp. ok626]|uniref:hypothetical protein n=1 Tax=Pedobacter sp. ok626 TaxID=1761882 RepID=UPI00088C717F|nr:hypothetical protein [Pedobacter sp. ok626]SDK20152.1 hypothetical protein SAMN04487898_106303 [Pedobacter sp. ok626]